MPNFAVTVLGHRNAGKSTTWKNLFGATVKTGKYQRRLYLNSGPTRVEGQAENLTPKREQSHPSRHGRASNSSQNQWRNQRD